jgi:hypothetical protein
MERVWVSRWDMERAPRKLGWWGAKRVEKRGERKLTMSAFNFPQFTQYLLHFDYEASGKVSNCHNEPK